MGLFSKGITLRAYAALSTPPLLETPVPEQVILPLRHYVGEPATPTVSPGDSVRAGQLIATASGPNSLPVHASISGTVGAISEQLTVQGLRVPAITIDTDGTDSAVELPAPDTDTATLSAEQICERIQAAGLTTCGTLPVPLAADLAPVDQPKTHLSLTHRPVTKGIDTLIITALDREPALQATRYQAGREHDELPAGIEALKRVTGAERTVVVVDKSSPIAPQITGLVAADEEETTSIVRLDARHFPVGLPVPLIKAVTGRELPLPYGHPRDVGVALCDLATVIAIGAGVTRQAPQTEIMITVGGGSLKAQGVVAVKIGTPVGVLVEALGGVSRPPGKLIVGGPMTGMAHYDMSVPITKEVTGVFALSPDELTLTVGYRECINCGRCVAVCPVNLVPGMLSMYCAKDRFDEARQEGLFTCIECGCCDHVCPSRRPLVHLFRHAKHQLTEQQL